jgi:hypothetical protein
MNNILKNTKRLLTLGFWSVCGSSVYTVAEPRPIVLAPMMQWRVADEEGQNATSPTLRILFWNVENLFDTQDDPQTNDSEFLPQSARHWTPKRYRTKLQHVGEVIVESGGWRVTSTAQWQPPACIACAEVENETVLRDLLRRTPVGQMGYVPLITHSPDRRGINIAFLYRPMAFRLIGFESWRLVLPGTSRPTRDLLHVWGCVAGAAPDTLDLIFCHLPSRYGGATASQPARSAAHRCMRQHIDSLTAVRRQLSVLVLGDMNDYPHTPQLQQELRLLPPPLKKPKSPASGLPLLRTERIQADSLYNLMLLLNRKTIHSDVAVPTLPTAGIGDIPATVEVYGSHKYQGKWGFLDQCFVTGSVLRRIVAYGVFCRPMMLTEDATHLGVRPLRSYYGYRYEGGYSDHLPIIVDLH